MSIELILDRRMSRRHAGRLSADARIVKFGVMRVDRVGSDQT